MAKTAGKLASAVESALPTVATVVCDLISRYADEPPHRLQTAGLDRSVWQITPISETETNLTYNSNSADWHTIVSETDIGQSPATWTIRTDVRKCIYFGVTAETTNQTNVSRSETRNWSWTIGIYGRLVRIYGETEIAETFQLTDGADCIRFTAVPETRRITARIGDLLEEVVLITAGTDDKFRLLRPCIVLTGNVTAALTSGP